METENVVDVVKQFTNVSSQIGDERPISACKFSPSGNHLATASWSGDAKVCISATHGELYVLIFRCVFADMDYSRL